MRRILAALAASALLLAACGSEDGTEPTPSAEPTTEAPSEPTGSAAAVPGTPGVDLPEVSGTFGERPVLTFPDSPPEGLTIATLEQGDGREVKPGDIQVVNYYGVVWGNDTPFDNSYDRGQPNTFEIGGLVAGWRDGIVGAHEGDRLVLSIPSELGYGPSGGNAGAGIGPDDTIVFVVDILNSGTSDDFVGEAGSMTGELPEGITIDGEPGSPAVAVVADGTPEPAEDSFVVLVEGSGPPIDDDSLIFAGYSGSFWDNTPLGSSWTTVTWGGEEYPQGLSYPMLLAVGSGTPFDDIVGVPVGSRVLFTFAGNDEAEIPAQIYITDIISAH